MTFAHYDFARGASIHEHFHPEEEVYEVTLGELEVTIDGVVIDFPAPRSRARRESAVLLRKMEPPQNAIIVRLAARGCRI